MSTTLSGLTQKIWPVILLLCLGGIVLLDLGPRLFSVRPYPVGAWLGTAALLGLFVLFAGYGVTQLWRGALIDDRNKISLSRLQMVLWTMLILSALITAALINISRSESSPLAIAVPQQLWVVIGISTTALVGSPLILSVKKDQPNNAAATTRTKTLLAQRTPVPTTTDVGQVLVNNNPNSASWADLFSGEEVGNAAQLDMGKIQMFFFTVILLIAYGAALGNLFATQAPPITKFPTLDNSFIALLGISTGGYLTNKIIPHTPTVN